MKTTSFDYYDKFRCIAGNCIDNCCIGWEIDIDEKSLDYYKSLGDEFGQKLCNNIDFNTSPAHFILNGERCPFLNENNLCNIILNKGEDKICEICTLHPRYFEWYNDLCEAGIGLCCEEAGRLILTDKSRSLVTSKDDSTDYDKNCDSKLLSSLISVREVIFNIIKTNDISFENRLILALLFCCEVQDCLEDDETSKLKNIAKSFNSKDVWNAVLAETNAMQKDDNISLITKLIDIYLSLEQNDEKWGKKLLHLKEKLCDVLSSKDRFFEENGDSVLGYENIAIYFIYRYFLKSVFDNDVLSKIHLCISSYIIIHLLDVLDWLENGKISLANRIVNTKAYSKEVEY
ncbi:MAG: flagellin lysine-N-methylase, partial [Oscillospiraceae bacterium]|nr:flagellin lysine-N-methylase [Oscillospiraceae bacterium]